jgi:hypothetical protein
VASLTLRLEWADRLLARALAGYEDGWDWVYECRSREELADQARAFVRYRDFEREYRRSVEAYADKRADILGA